MNISFLYSLEQKLTVPVDSEWIIQQEGLNIHTEREFETLSSISNGFIGTRNSLEENLKNISTPATFVAGVYEYWEDDDVQELVKIPDWTNFEIFIDGEQLTLLNTKTLYHKRYIDLQKGICIRNWINIDDIGRITNIKIMKFISINDKNLCFKKILIKPENYSGDIKIRSGISGQKIINKNIYPALILKDNVISYVLKINDNKSLSLSQISNFCNACDYSLNVDYEYKFLNNDFFEEWKWNARIDKIYSVTSLVSIFSSIESENPEESSCCHLLEQTFDPTNRQSLIELHFKEWENLWNKSYVQIIGSERSFTDQKCINFAIYHLLSAGKFSGGSYSIPARTLTGESYKGHIFWDTEMFLLPFYTYTNPDMARALLMYRYNTLDGARRHAKESYLRGACYAWESTDTGDEAAPFSAMLPNGEVLFIYSGTNENHISPDIAYSVWKYWIITGDDDFLFDYGAEIIFETARFCASYVTFEEDGLYHTKDVVGPDEYHELVDDNAYTNLMLQHNLEISIKLIEMFKQKDEQKLNDLIKKINLSKQEIKQWQDIAEKIYIGYNDETKIFEQFKGFYELEDIKVKDYEPRNTPMDLILGRERTRKTKVIKQADVLMFLFLLREKFSKEIISANYNYYEPKTGHGSSLSPSIHSIIAAWTNNKEDAYKYFEQNAQIDLGDAMGNASGGIHIAALGGTWMTIVLGFSGINFTEEGLNINPCLPNAWDEIKFPMIIKKQPLTLELTNKSLKITHNGDSDISVKVCENNWKILKANDIYICIKDELENWTWI